MSDQVVTTNQPASPSIPEGVPNGGHPITIEVRVRLQALAIPEPGGGYSVVVPALPGCVTMGETIEEIQANVVEAAEGWLEVAHNQAEGEALRVALGE
jgi:predicted RNase H-like HicB family nuclease